MNQSRMCTIRNNLTVHFLCCLQ